MAFLKFEDIDKSFGENNVISKFNLEVEKGKFIVLLGPSGCGKSTLLRMIAGLEKIDNGKIFLENNLLNDLLPSKRQIAMVFQSYALYPHMNVFQNISFGLKSEKISKNDIKNKVMEAAKILKIDEPLSNLDAALRSEMRVEISKLHKKLKSNVVYVTHDQIEAMTLADQIVILNKGKIEQFGSPDEIYDNPNNIFVAEFIGNPKMNIFKVKTENISNKNTFKLFNNEIKFENLNLNNGLYVGIRPEDISLENKSIISAEITIDLIENLGSEKIIYTHINGSEIRIKSTQNIKDKNITIYLPKNKLYLFDNNKNRLKA